MLKFPHRIEASLNNTRLSALIESKRCCKSFSSTSPSHILLLCVTSGKSHFALAHLQQVDDWNTHSSAPPFFLRLNLTKQTLILTASLPLPLVLLPLPPILKPDLLVIHRYRTASNLYRLWSHMGKNLLFTRAVS